MTQVSDLIQSLSPSATLVMSQKSSELKAAGVDVINLSVGEPDFNTPDFIKEAACRAVRENYSFYSPVPGYMSLREAISRKLMRENGVDYKPEQIVVSGGAKQALCNVILSLVNPSDEVIIPTPAWVSYVEMVKLARGKNVIVPCPIEDNFKITPDRLRAAITPATKLIIICSPSNPTGSVYSKDELQALVDVLVDYPDVMIMADEIYEHINFTNSFTSLASFGEIADRVVIINGVSKAYAMTGWRIGFCAAPLWLAKAVTKLQSQYTSGCSSIAQKAAEAAYNGPQDCVKEMCDAFRRRRDLIVSLAKEIPGFECTEPQGAFYLFPRVTSLLGKRYGDTLINSSADLTLYLLDRAHVATVDGAAFCLDGYIRLSYATSDDNIREAMRRIKESLTF